MAEGNQILSEVANNKKLSDWLEKFNDSDISNIIESITYDSQSQQAVTHMRNLIKDADAFEKINYKNEHALVELTMLSSTYRNKYPNLLKSYRDWKPYREKLIQTSSSCANSIDRNSTLVSVFRIATSLADIVGTILRYQQSNSYWAHFAAENAPYCGLSSLFLEMILSNSMCNKVREATEKDQEMFKPMKDWFKQTEELDKAVKNIFPSDIDKGLVRKIHKTCSDSDDSVKIFISVVVSSAKINLQLFKDIGFLELAQAFSSSEYGEHWYQKIIYEGDPVWIECMKCNFEEEIKKITPKLDDPNQLANGSVLFARGVKFKILLDVIAIYSAVNRLWDGSKCKESKMLRDLSLKTNKELNEMTSIVTHLKPSGIDMRGLDMV